jgi:hypothetical protein
MMSSSEFSLTAEEASLLPSEEDVRFYAEHGWYLSGKLFSDDEIDALVAASDEYYDGARDHRLPTRPAKLAYWQPEHGEVQRHNDYVHYEATRSPRSCASRCWARSRPGSRRRRRSGSSSPP